jgi:hypothetical protein
MPGEAEALVGNTSLKVLIGDALLESVNRLFGTRVAELRLSRTSQSRLRG